VEVDSLGGTYLAAQRFIECLTALPNLHTLEIISRWYYNFRSFLDVLKKRKPQFQQVRALVLPDEVHWLLRCCPNVEDLTCHRGTPAEAFVESLVVGGLNRITRFSVLSPSWSGISLSRDHWSSRIYFISFSPPTSELIRILTVVAMACPGIRELSIVHVSLTSVTLCRGANVNIGTFHAIPS